MFNITGMNCGVVWDAERDQPLIRFQDGVAETDDQTVAERLRALGYTVEGDGKKTTKPKAAEGSVALA